MRCFSPEFDKNSKNHRFLPTFCLFLHIFRIFSNLAEKQRMKLSNLKCLRFSSSFDTHATSGRAKIVGEKNFCQNSHSAIVTLPLTNSLESTISLKHYSSATNHKLLRVNSTPINRGICFYVRYCGSANWLITLILYNNLKICSKPF